MPEGESPFTPIKNAAYYRREARAVLKNRWGIAIIVTLLAMLLGGVAGGFSFNFSFSNTGTSSDAEMEESFQLTEEQLAKLEQHLQNGDYETIFRELNERIPSLPTLLTIFFIGFMIATIFSLAFAIFVSSPIKLGYQRFQLELIDNNPQGIQVQTLFRYFKESYFKSIGLNLLHSLILFVTQIPLLIFTVLGALQMIASIPSIFSSTGEQMYWNFALSILGMLGLILLGAILSLVIRIPITYMYTFAHMIMAEYPTVGVIDALRTSRNLMRGNKWKLFCLEFSFIGWIILATICCGIGMIVVQPYMEAARAAFYNDITNRSAAKEAEFPSINPDDYIAL